MLATPDQQISPTDPDARSMATSGRGSGILHRMWRNGTDFIWSTEEAAA